MTEKKNYEHEKVMRLQKAVLKNNDEFDATYLLCAYLQYVCDEQMFDSILRLIEMSDTDVQNWINSL